MGFLMAYYFATFVVLLITHKTIFPVKGQCTVQGCDNGDRLVNIVAEIQQLRVDLFDQLNKQVQSIHDLLYESLQQMKCQHNNVNMSLQAVDRRLLEQNICIKQGQSIHELLNESFQEMKSQHGSIMKGLRAVDRRLQEHDISIKNQTHNSWDLANGSCSPASDVCDCSDIKASGETTSGVYEVCAVHQLNRTCTYAYCEMDTNNGTSMVFQRRKDGSVNFNRTWADYKRGFGNPNGEFWFGNEMLYLLTSKRNYKLRVDLEDFTGAKRYAEYAIFSINSSHDNYRLTVSGYSGNAGNSLAYHSGKRFSTIDVDNDKYRLNPTCAQQSGGGWWFEYCFHSSLNGIYYHQYATTRHAGIKWGNWRGDYYSLKAAEMKLIPVA